MNVAIRNVPDAPGDLGRRIAGRRVKLGLSVTDVAARTGMAPSYIDYLEGTSTASLTHEALLKLAAALQTTAAALTGEARPAMGSSARDVAERIRQAFERQADSDASRVVVTADAGRIVLEGTVRSWAERHAAETAAWAGHGVTAVVNKLVVTERPAA